MLKAMSQFKRSQNIILLSIVGILVVGMIVVYSTPGRSLSWLTSGDHKKIEPVEDDSVIADVGGYTITAKEYSDGIDRFIGAYKNMAQTPGAQLPTSIRDLRQRGTDKELLKSLIREKLIEIEAHKLGLVATDDELRDRIRTQYSKDGKWIGYEKFRKALEKQGIDILDFERDIRQSITEEKLRSFVTGGIQIPQQEIEKDYKKTNTKFDFGFTVIKDTNFLQTVTLPTDEEAKAYFESHKDLFKSNKEQRKVSYLYINQEKAGESIPVSDEELLKRFDPEKYVKSIRVKQIVLKVLTPKDQSTVKAKADDLVQRARGTASKPGENFEALARGNSQDTITASKDGDLGLIERNNIKQGDALESALSLKVNEISEPISKDNAFYIFKVVERNLKTFVEAKSEILPSVRNDLSYKRASELADKAETLFAKVRDIKKVANEIAKEMSTKEVTVKPEDLIRETPFFVPGDDLQDIGSNPSFEETTSILTQENEVGTKVGIRGGFAIPQLLKIRKAIEPTFEDVKDKVVEKAKKERMLKMAYDQATKLLAEAKTTSGLKAASEKMELKFEEAKDFSIGSLMGGKNFPAIYYYAEKAKAGELISAPLYSTPDQDFTAVAVIGVINRTEADMTKLGEKSKSISENLRNVRASALFETYLENIKYRMKETKQLKIYNDVVERILVSKTAMENMAVQP